jgi:hypothetical protein
MNTNLNTLFDFTKWPKRKPTSQRQFESENREIISSFIPAVHSSFKKLHTIVLKAIEPIDQSNLLPAIVMSGYLNGFFKRRYMHLCGKATKQRFRLLLNDTYVYVKKLDEKTKLPSNIPTDESLRIYFQLTNTEQDKNCNIFFGYTVNEAWSMITGIFAVCIEGNEVLWLSDLNDIQDSLSSPVTPLPPKPNKPKLKPNAKRKKKDNKQIE